MPELYLSTSVHKVDRKGRVSVPSRFRTAIVPSDDFHGVVLFPPIVPLDVPPTGQPDTSYYSGCSRERFATYTEAGDGFNPLIPGSRDLDSRDLDAVLFDGVEELSFDSEGRVVLPPKVIDQCQIEGEACFVGFGKTFQIWSEGRFKAEVGRAREAVSRRLQRDPR